MLDGEAARSLSWVKLPSTGGRGPSVTANRFRSWEAGIYFETDASGATPAAFVAFGLTRIAGQLQMD